MRQSSGLQSEVCAPEMIHWHVGENIGTSFMFIFLDKKIGTKLSFTNIKYMGLHWCPHMVHMSDGHM